MKAGKIAAITILVASVGLVAPVQAERWGRRGGDRFEGGHEDRGWRGRGRGYGRPGWARPGVMAPGRKVVLVPERVVAQPRGRPFAAPPVLFALPPPRPRHAQVVVVREPEVCTTPAVMMPVHRPAPVVVAVPPPAVCTTSTVVAPLPGVRTQVETAKVHTRNTLLAVGLANEALNRGGQDKVRIRNASLGLMALNELFR